MKKLITSLLPVLFIGLLFTSCKKETIHTPEEEVNQHLFQCKIDGEVYKATGINAYAVDFGDYYAAYGVGTGEMLLYVIIDKNIGLGTSEMDFSTKGYISIDQNTSLTSALDGGSGKVTVTEITDQFIVGTFEYAAINFEDPNEKRMVTEGQFRVPFR